MPSQSSDRLVWCNCSSCAKSSETKPNSITLEPEHGLWVSPQVFTLHRRTQTTVLAKTLRNGASSSVPVRSRDLEPVTEPMDVVGDGDAYKGQRLTKKNLSALNSQFDHIVNAFERTPLALDFGAIDVANQDLRQPPPKLKYSHPENQRYLNHYRWIQEQLRYVDGLQGDMEDAVISGEKTGLKRRMKTGLDELDTILAQQWSRACLKAVHSQTPTSTFPQVKVPMIRAEAYFPELSAQPFVLVVLLLASLLDTLAGVSRPLTSLILMTFRVALTGAFMLNNREGPLTPEQQAAIDALPTDPRTARKRFNLDPDYIRYVCCPQCFALYPPDTKLTRCTFVDLGNICNGDLFHPPTPINTEGKADRMRRKYHATRVSKSKETKVEEEVRKPLRVFGYQTLQSWLSRFVNRPNIEEHLDAAWKQSHQQDDIWSGEALQEFGQNFVRHRRGAYNLVFSLFVDWFNPYGNKQAGKSYSTGVIYMVCLNLPPHLRFRLENVYLVGVIPGPREPSLHQINHVLRPLVDAFLQFWETGFFITRTYLHQSGRLVQGAIIPLVCDLPAARKVAGFVGHGARLFCSFCQIEKSKIQDVSSYPSQKRSTYEEHVERALSWLNAPNKNVRTQLEREHGVRWSELLRLPYWNPLKYTVLDAMHNLFLGELKHHCREVWGLDIKEKKGRKTQPHDYKRQVQDFGKAVLAIQNLKPKSLNALRKGYTVAIATLNNVEVTSSTRTHKDYISAVIDWYKQADPKPTIRIPDLQPDDVESEEEEEVVQIDHSIHRVITNDTLHEIHSDIARITFPTWLERPPRNFGSPSHGKLKADQWRTVCTVNLVITLIRLWGTGRQWEKDLLRNFLDLVIAVEHASKRTMNPARVEVYAQHMFRYLLGVRQLFPHHKFTPNHHLSFHLMECLRLFGPVHSWWSFPFERYNGVISRFNKNHKPSEMEITFLETFCRGSNLRALLPRLIFSSSLYQNLIQGFQGMFLAWGRQGTLVADVLSFSATLPHVDQDNSAEKVAGVAKSTTGEAFQSEEDRRVPLEEGEYALLLKRVNQDRLDRPYADYRAMVVGDEVPLPRDAQFLRRIQIGACVYNSFRSTKSLGNSFIIFRLPGEQVRRAGQIQDIFLHRRYEDGIITLEPFLVVAEYEPLVADHRKHDLYSSVEYLDTWLCYNQLIQTGFVIRTTDIVSHFASYVYTPPDIKRECIVVRSLDRT